MECGARVSDELAGVFSEKSPECGEKKRFRCECAYDGTDFCGWQSQKGGGSVQDFIEDRLLKILKSFWLMTVRRMLLRKFAMRGSKKTSV